MRLIAPEVIAYGESFLRDCPVTFSYDLVFVPSSTLEMQVGGEMKDTSWVGIVIYEDDINRFPEPDRVQIGLALKNARDAFMNAGFKCEFYPLAGKREDHHASDDG